MTGWVSKTSCYDLDPKSLEWKTTLVLSNTRELNEVPSIDYSILYTLSSWSMLSCI